MTRVVVAEQERPRRLVEPLPQPREGAVLAVHVVSAGRELPERRSPHDERLLTDLDEVGQVRRAVGELEDPELAVQVGKVVRR